MTRAIVLGGGGVTGIAWETGVLAGLAQAGDDLRADAVIGTSAGAFVGTALAAGADLEELYVAQQQLALDEHTVGLPRMALVQYVWAFVRARRQPQQVALSMSRIARRRRPRYTADERRRIVASRLATSHWPATLRVTALDADTGETCIFTGADGVALVDAVSASSAVPGISPPVTIGGRTFIDGGMASAANARLAAGFDDVLVIAPIPAGFGGLPSAADDVKALRAAGADVRLIVPDAASRAAIGRNIFDVNRRAPASAAGRAQAAGPAARA